MHRIDTTGHVGYKFDDGTPPADGTICNDDWLNAVQEELALFIEAYGQTLSKGTWTQLQDAMKVHARDNPVVYVASGSNGLYAITTSPPISSYADGMKFIFKSNHANLYEVAKLNVDSVGSVDIRGTGGWKLIANSILPNSVVEVIYSSAFACFLVVGDHVDYEIADARGNQNSLSLRIDKGLNQDGYVDAIAVPGGNCLVHHWYHWRVGGTDKSYNMTLAKTGTGTYTATFTGMVDFISDQDYILLFSTNAGANGLAYHVQVQDRFTTHCTLKTYKDGSLIDMDADHYIAFVGNKH